MPIIDIDKIPGISDPIRVQLDGEQFTCVGFTKDLLDRVTALGEGPEEDQDARSFHEICASQLAIIFDKPSERFLSIEARKLKATVQLVMEELQKAGESRAKRRASSK